MSTHHRKKFKLIFLGEQSGERHGNSYSYAVNVTEPRTEQRQFLIEIETI